MAEGAEIRLISVFQEESAIQAKAWIADFFRSRGNILSSIFRTFATRKMEFLAYNERVLPLGM